MTDLWKNKLDNLASEEKAKILSRFFKTGPGEYGEGDVFAGITVPSVRSVAREVAGSASWDDIAQMVQSKVHEHRLCAFLVLVEKFNKAKKDDRERARIVDFYLSHARQANNWDLVDLSAPKILGEWMLTHPCPTLLHKLSKSDCLWEQRIAIVSTLTLIRHGLFSETIALAEEFLTHPHPLMHKATGWMLRETGKKDMSTLLAFLDRNATVMPRTALRYAIERLSPDMRQHYMLLPRMRQK